MRYSTGTWVASGAAVSVTSGISVSTGLTVSTGTCVSVSSGCVVVMGVAVAMGVVSLRVHAPSESAISATRIIASIFFMEILSSFIGAGMAFGAKFPCSVGMIRICSRKYAPGP